MLLVLQLLEMPLAQHWVLSHGCLSQTVDASVYRCDIPPWISIHVVHSSDGEGPILTLVVRIGSRVEVVGQIVGWEVHFVEQ